MLTAIFILGTMFGMTTAFLFVLLYEAITKKLRIAWYIILEHYGYKYLKPLEAGVMINLYTQAV